MPAPLSRELREQIIALRLSGWKIKGIADWTGVSRKCIYFWLKRWEESGDLQAHHREQYKRKTTEEQDAALIAARAADPTKTTRQLSNDYNISLDTVRRRLKAAGIMRGKPGKARKPRSESQHDGFSWVHLRTKMTDLSQSFDTAVFIQEIRDRPCIWDYTHEAYSNKAEKAKVWESLCSKFYDNFEEKQKKEKDDCVEILQRKWRSLKDCYNRELRASSLKKNVSGGTKRRKYIFFDHLSFLKPFAEAKGIETANSGLVQNEVGQPSTNEEQPTPASKKRKPPKKRPPKTMGSELFDKLATPKPGEPPLVTHTDSDLQFLMSLYDKFKIINMHSKIDAQKEILAVIKKYSTPQHQAPPHNPTYNFGDNNRYGNYSGFTGYNTVPYDERQYPISLYGWHPPQVELTEYRHDDNNQPDTRTPQVNCPDIPPDANLQAGMPKYITKSPN